MHNIELSSIIHRQVSLFQFHGQLALPCFAFYIAIPPSALRNFSSLRLQTMQQPLHLASGEPHLVDVLIALWHVQDALVLLLCDSLS